MLAITYTVRYTSLMESRNTTQTENEMTATNGTKHNVHDSIGKLMFKGMSRNNQLHGYDWPNSYGFITDDQIKSHRWEVVEINDPR